MRPARKRQYVEHLRIHYDVSQRRACRAMLLQGSNYYYKSFKSSQAPLRLRIKALAAARVRYGYWRIYILLRREGWVVNHQRVYRLYCEEGLHLRSKRPKRRIRVPHIGQTVQKQNGSTKVGVWILSRIICLIVGESGL